MKRDSGWNMCYINGNTTMLIFNLNLPIYVPTKLHSYINCNSYLSCTEMCLLTSPSPAPVLSLWAFQGQRSHIAQQNCKLGQVRWATRSLSTPIPVWPNPEVFQKWLYFASTPLFDSKDNKKLTLVFKWRQLLKSHHLLMAYSM